MVNKRTKSSKQRAEKLSVKDLNGDQILIFQEISRKADLNQILLLESHFKCNHAAYFQSREDGNLGFNYGSDLKASDYNAEDGNAFVVFEWEVEATTERDDEIDRPVQIKSIYMMQYQLPEKCDEGIAYLFLHHVGRVASYPYFRNQVSQKSWESNLDLPILPVISA